LAAYPLRYCINAEVAARLCVAVVAVCLLVGAGVQSGIAGDGSAASGDSVAEQSRLAGVVPALALQISPQRALASLAFLGAIAARNARGPPA